MTAKQGKTSQGSSLGWIKAVVCKLHHIKTQHQYFGRYSVDKLCAFHRYQETASIYRVLAVIILSPFPTLFVLIGLDCLKLRDPRLSVNEHATTFLRSAFSHSVMTYFILLACKQAMGFTASNSSYTHTRCMVIGTLVGVFNEAIWTTAAFTWKFPVPMREVLAVTPWTIYCVIFHYLLAKEDFSRAFSRLKRYFPVVTAQLVLFYAMIALSIVFAKIPHGAQLAMIFGFPIIKLTLKYQLWKFSRKLDDLSADVTICMIEISSSLYQTVCMQYVHSSVTVALIMGMDLLQALVESYTYMKHEYISDSQSTLHTAYKIAKTAMSRQNPNSTETEVENGSDTTATGTVTTSAKPQAAFSVTKSIDGQPSPRSALQNAWTFVALAVESSWRRMRRSKRRGSRYAVRGTSSSNALLRRKSSSRSSTAITLSSSMPHISVYMHPEIYREHNGRRLMDLSKIVPGRGSEVRVPDNQNDADKQADASGDQPDRRKSNGKIYATLNRSFSTSFAIEHSGELHQRRQTNTDREQEDSRRRLSSVVLLDKEAGVRASTVSPARNAKRRGSTIAAGIPIDNIVVRRRDQARILEQTLQLLFAAEVLLFAEYMEVFMPLLYASCIGTLWKLPNAKYNVILNSITETQVVYEVSTSVGYAALELLSFLSVYWFVKKRYGISALYQLAFLLETYWMTLQGKLIGCFITILNSSTIHQGIDLSFRFDVNAQLAGIPLDS